jgi:DNA polymerase III subunit delta
MNDKKTKKPQGLSIEDLIRSVKQGYIMPCYLFSGPEQFTADEGIEVLRDALIAPDQRSFNFDLLYGNDVQAHEIVALASAYPMMGERRMVVVKEIDRMNNPDVLTSYIKNPLESTVLVLVSEKPDLRKNPYRLFNETNTLDCKPLYDNQVSQWVMKRIKRSKKTISVDAASLLSAYTGTSMRQISNELDKLEIYTGDRSEITVEDVNAVVGVSKDFTIFELYKAVGFKDTSAAINILDRMLERGEYPGYIIRMLTRLFTHIATISDLSSKNSPQQKILSQTKINPFFLKEYLGYLSHHPVHSIPDRFKALLEADTALKTTGKDKRLVLSMLLYRLMDKDTSPLDPVDEFEEQLNE